MPTHDEIAARNLLHIAVGDIVRWDTPTYGGYIRGIVKDVIAGDRRISSRPPYLIISGQHTTNKYRVNLDNPTLSKVWEEP